MAFKFTSHLKRNRFGILYFRLAVPTDLVDRVGQRELYRSLRTSELRAARIAAQALYVNCWRVFELIRVVEMSDTNNPSDADKAMIDRMLNDVIPRVKKDMYLRDLLEEARADADGARRQVQKLNKQQLEIKQSNAELASRNANLFALIGNGAGKIVAAPTPLLSKVYDLFCDAKTATKTWKDPEHNRKYVYGPVIDDFIAVVGDKQIGELGDDDIRKYKAWLLASPERLATKQKKSDFVKAMLNWCRNERYLRDDFSKMLSLGKKGQDTKHYEPFDAADLRALFESEPYRCGQFRKASEFWIPLIGLYSGARINEIAQLHLDDIKEIEGIPALDINDEDLKRTKNASSIRSIPIHPKLIEIGFIDYVALMRNEGHLRVFPELSMGRDKDGFGKEPSRFFTDYRRELGVVTPGEGLKAPGAKTPERGQKVFHSFRTTANTMLRRAEVPKERRERLVGHTLEGVNNETYAPVNKDDLFKFSTLLTDLSKLDFKLDHARYVPSAHHAMSRLKAVARRGKEGR